MKEYIEKPIPKDVTREQYEKLQRENAIGGLKVVGENIPEIREIFKVQLEKPGHPYREIAVDEIIKYLYQNRMDKYEVGLADYLHWDYLYARTLYKLADIIKAVNEEDLDAFTKAMEALPWGDSNTGDQISWNTSRFAYAIMSDEARQKFYEPFLEVVHKGHYGETKEATAKIVEGMGNLAFLPSLMEANIETANEVKAKKPGQPGDC